MLCCVRTGTSFGVEHEGAMKSGYMLDKKTLLLVIGAAVGTLFFVSSWWRERCMHCVAYPIILAEQRVIAPVKRWLLWRRGVHELHALTEKLLAERNAALAELVELRGTRDYLTDCAECIEFKKRYGSTNVLVAQIMLRHFSDVGHYFFIDAGEHRGVKKDMVAIYDNCLLGRVSEVYPHYSKVLLISDRECHVAVRCAETGTRGIHSGLNEREKSIMEFVNHLDPVRVGDLIISQGEGLIFPRGFAVGKVASFELSGVQYTVTVEPLLDVNALRFCLLLTEDVVAEAQTV